MIATLPIFLEKSRGSLLRCDTGFRMLMLCSATGWSYISHTSSVLCCVPRCPKSNSSEANAHPKWEGPPGGFVPSQAEAQAGSNTLLPRRIMCNLVA